jgi:hypothetical protein
MKRALDATDAELIETGRRGRERVLRMHDVHREASRLKELFASYAAHSS